MTRAKAAEKAFQFTRPRGARHPQLADGLRTTVSIHAPTGGATPKPSAKATPPCFNSRAHGGRDSSQPSRRSPTRRFNSRAHGGRDSSARRARRRYAFQFTRPRGARQTAERVKHLIEVSIHAPTGGATTSPLTLSIADVFQFTRPRGARLVAHGRAAAANVSIHAPTGGATRRARNE